MIITEFRTEKPVYSVGEPVSLTISIKNEDTAPSYSLMVRDLANNRVLINAIDELSAGESETFVLDAGAMPEGGLSIFAELFTGTIRTDTSSLLIPVEIVAPVGIPEEREEVVQVSSKIDVPVVGGVDFLSNLFRPLASAWEVGNKWLGDSFNVIAGAFKPIIDFFSNPVESIKGFVIGTAQQGIEESIKQNLALTEGLKEGSPEWEKKLVGDIDAIMGKEFGEVGGKVSKAIFTGKPNTAESAAASLNTLRDVLYALNLSAFSANAVIEAGTLGQVEAWKEIKPFLISPMGFDAILQRGIMLPFEKSIGIPAEYFYNRLYVPEIPVTSELINQVVKEVIPFSEFEAQMRNRGFNREWSQRIWDAHFIAPTLGDIILSWRRDVITEERLDQLMILVDLDPRFKEIFDQRKYIDPTVRTARWGFESGSIDEDRVQQVVKRAGYLPEDIKWVTEVQTTFQEREYRQRYLTALASGITYGVYTPAELTEEVVAAGYQPAVAGWMIKTAEVRRRIREESEPVHKPKILSVADLKKAYLRSKIDEGNLIQELLKRGYELSEIDILVSILKEDKAFVDLGAKKKALSESQLTNAFKYDRITEDELRIELSLRGLSQDEINILIDTLKLKWGKS